MKVNLRDTPAVTGKVLGMLNRPEEVGIIATVETGDTSNSLWAKVTTSRGVTGYVSARYVSTEGGPPKPESGIVPGNWSVGAHDGLLLIRDSQGREVCRRAYRGEAGEIVKSQHAEFLFIAIMSRESVISLLTMVYDTSKRRALYLTREMDNPRVISISPLKRYMLVDSGTAASVRSFTVIDLAAGRETAHDSYFAGITPAWKSPASFEYYMTVGPRAPGKPDLPRSADGRPNSYAQKIIWDSGRVRRLDEYIAVYSEEWG